MLPRKNGKTELAAALAVYFLLFDGEVGGEVYSAAADKEQAALVFNVAAQMIRNDAELDAQCEIVDSQKRIVHRKSNSSYKAISAEAYHRCQGGCPHLLAGFRPGLVIGRIARPVRSRRVQISTISGTSPRRRLLIVNGAGDPT